jgi:hypothetical protein
MATNSLHTARAAHTATLLTNGKLLVAGGYGPVPGLGNAALSASELYDPALGTWTVTGTLNDPREHHTATLLPNGQVLAAGGYSSNSGAALSSAEQYNVGLGFMPSWQPQITTFTSPLSLGSSLVFTGSQFRGVSEGSGGNCGQDSPADYPVVQLLSVGNEQTTFLLSTSWSSSFYVSAAVAAAGPGYALLTVFVNGIPSTSGITDIPTGIPLPLPFEITSIVRTNGHDLLITWNTTGSSNVVQVTAGTAPSGSYATNGFTDVTNIVVTTAATNFWDVGAATNYPARYYRIRSPE